MSVITTPAPPLPVRGEHFRQAVSPMLTRLAAERATGVLLRESGSLYLSEGKVVHAESPRSPGLDVLLATGGILDSDGWREAVDTAGAGLRVGRFLVDSGRVARGALELCHAGALFDAAYFVLGPSSAPASFRYGAAHWLGPIRPVPVATVEREARRRRDLLHRIWPDPATDEAPLVRAAGLDAPPVPARQGAVLGQVNGLRTAAEISLTLGRPAFHTLVDVRRLAAAGLISTARRSPVPSPSAPTGLVPSPPVPTGSVPSPPVPPGPVGTRPGDAPATPRGHAPATHPGLPSPPGPNRTGPSHLTPVAAHHLAPADPSRIAAADPGPFIQADPAHLAPADPHHLTASDTGSGPSAGLSVGSTAGLAAGPVAGMTAGVEAAHPTPPWPLTTPDPDVALLQRLRDALEAL
ncbi:MULTISPECIES: hypothetical protein [Streptomyces]|uniref:hypothetical protein n=1 Tax=Streptomyces TaxID=1883 RepID=UPI0005EE6696|nr:hypothetical protein [Streptomyces caniscabiei]MBE4758878.1 hypothetical protein [Streptomyces caniscabiei]MBE4770021.1 hypothetical protein [Streptomyces caniscabiei]MBE4785166.1 hypothetical protein [Streptomyces caniscabiei]MBE4797729.1 hypothetical protein [Streptomyces caniscabiei]